MIRHLFKGIIRDRSRSFLPIIVVSIGVSLTVLLSGYIRGAFDDIIDQNAKFDTGHVKIMSKSYRENKDLLPNDLALLGVNHLMDSLQQVFPDMIWTERIRFGGLIDAPDTEGLSKGQGPASGLGINLLNRESGEAERMNIESSLVTGSIPTKPGGVILAHAFSEKLGVKVGDQVTFFGTTMNNSMTFQNFTVSGTIRFGTAAMDRGSVIIDISDAQMMLDMQDGAGEILGFFNDNAYVQEKAQYVTDQFNASYKSNSDEFAPVMLTLRDQNGLAQMLDYSQAMSSIFVFLFVMAMSVVLWNTGLLGGLRRYKEFGIRLALGEGKGHIYRSLLMESVLIGVIGSIIGTSIGLLATYLLQVYGIDISDALENSTMLMPSVIRAKITPELFFIGFIPGVLATVVGSMLSGIGIYKRSTASLFKELEV